VRTLVTPTENSRLYPLIIGEHGTGKTSLIQLAVDGVNKDGPKGIAYVDMPDKCNSEAKVVKVLQEALGWSPDPVIDSGEGNYSSPLPVGIFEANIFVATSVEEVLKYLSGVASKYRKKHKRVPVLIIDNVNRLVQDGQEWILDLFQNYAKRGCDEGTVTVVFVSSEGTVPRRMMGKSIMLMVLFIC
jgi:KaiC/GvpD/RAD55 family RecA-like ATPase